MKGSLRGSLIDPVLGMLSNGYKKKKKKIITMKAPCLPQLEAWIRNQINRINGNIPEFEL